MPSELWTIFAYVATRWQAPSDMTKDQLELAVNGQTQLEPNYAGWVSETLARYRALLESTGSEDAALAALYAGNQQPEPESQGIATVLANFMSWSVAFGGFRSFGYENYPGWMGGGSFEQRPPPYRALSQGGSEEDGRE